MAAIHDLKKWFERDIRSATWAENVLITDEHPEGFEARLYTDTNEYTILVSAQADDAPLIECTVRSRKARAGLSNARTRPLLMGPSRRLNERVWRLLLGAIVGLELVRVHRRAPPEDLRQAVTE